jgi:hypothetical protein
MVASNGLFNIVTNQEIVAIHHKFIIATRKTFTKPNINILKERWLPCDLLWAPNLNYVMKLKGNEEIMLKEIFFVIVNIKSL